MTGEEHEKKDKNKDRHEKDMEKLRLERRVHGLVVRILSKFCMGLALGHGIISIVFRPGSGSVFNDPILIGPQNPLTIARVSETFVFVIAWVAVSYSIGAIFLDFVMRIVNHLMYSTISITLGASNKIKRKIMGENPPKWKSYVYDTVEILLWIGLAVWVMIAVRCSGSIRT